MCVCWRAIVTTPSIPTEHAQTGAKSRDQRLLNASWLGDAVTVRQCLVSVLHHLVGVSTVFVGGGGGGVGTVRIGMLVQSIGEGIGTVHGGVVQSMVVEV